LLRWSRVPSRDTNEWDRQGDALVVDRAADAMTTSTGVVALTYEAAKAAP
jgi:hypothetical protein